MGAKPSDYVKATQRVYHAAGLASFIEFPIGSANRDHLFALSRRSRFNACISYENPTRLAQVPATTHT